MLPLSMEKGGQTYYFAYDQVGSLRLVTASSGSVVKRNDYDSFGNIITETNEAFKIPFGFAGGLHDRDTGLVRFGFRDYDPDTGRWTAKDPLLFDGGDTDLYGYVLNNPVNYFDPLGLWYIDLNFSYSLGIIGPTVGVMLGPEGIYRYHGGGIILPPGLGGGITFSPGDASAGFNVAVQAGFPIPIGSSGFFIPIGAQTGVTHESWDKAFATRGNYTRGNEFWEVGLVWPGVSVTAFKAWHYSSWEEVARSKIIKSFRRATP